MIRCSYIELEYLLFFCIDGEKIRITVPAYDIYDQCPFSMYVSETKFKCTYYTYIFEYDRDISEMYLKVYNRLDKKSLDILLNQISEEDYRRASIPIDRKAILREKYGCTTEYKPLYTYIFSDELIPMIRDYYDKDMDEFEKVKIGLGWLQEHIKHSPKDNFVMRQSARELFVKSCNGDRKLNCRNMAVVLNTLYTNMLLKSRYIICLQKEDKIDNCHFVVEVYISKWNKWILVDSSYGLLFRAGKKYLSLQEVRSCMADDVTVEIETIKNKFNIELYWRNYVKKLYRFRRPLISGNYYDEQDLFVELVPSLQDYDMSENIILVDNVDVFWTD